MGRGIRGGRRLVEVGGEAWRWVKEGGSGWGLEVGEGG